MIQKEIFNAENLLRFTENDKKLSVQLLSLALNDMPEFLLRANVCIRNKEYKDAAVWIHKIKGIAGTIGAEIIYELCVSTESVLKKYKDIADSEELLIRMANSVDDFCGNSEVQNWIN